MGGHQLAERLPQTKHEGTRQQFASFFDLYDFNLHINTDSAIEHNQRECYC
jgi:hypothetical protein